MPAGPAVRREDSDDDQVLRGLAAPRARAHFDARHLAYALPVGDAEGPVTPLARRYVSEHSDGSGLCSRS